MKKRIRIIRIAEVQVVAEYGDTPETLCGKATFPAKFVEDRILIPDDEAAAAEPVASDEGVD